MAETVGNERQDGGGSDKQMELQLGGRHLTMAMVGLVLFGTVLFLLGRWSERVARPAEAPAVEGIQETTLHDDSKGAPDSTAPHELTFYETLGKKTAAGFQESAKFDNKKEPPAAVPKAAESSAAPVKAAPPAPVSPAGDAPTEHYRIQVASTRDGGSARQLVDRLRKKGYSAGLETSREKDGKVLYKVRVGSYRDRAPAEKTAARIRSEEKVGAWIVKVQG